MGNGLRRVPFQDQLLAALRPFPPADRYLVGVSGGRDSVALLHGLLRGGYRRLVVCHLDHGLRGEPGAADARFVGELAAGFRLVCELGRTDVAGLAAAEGSSLETVGREARRRFFATVARRRRCGAVFLAHHADDRVETFLLHLLRGAGPAGLGAMTVESRQRVSLPGSARPVALRLLRPLLGIWRAEIDADLAARGLRWREDPTNADPAHATRNRLRLETLPTLARALGRPVAPALWRAAELLAEEERWLAATLAPEIAALPARLPVRGLAEETVARQRRLLRAWLAARGVAGIGFREVESVRALLDAAADGPAKVNLPGGCHARRRAGVLFVETPAGTPSVETGEV